MKNENLVLFEYYCIVVMKYMFRINFDLQKKNQYRYKMSLVYRNSKLPKTTSNPVLGPGSYNLKGSFFQSNKKRNDPIFLSATKRIPQNNQQSQLGPGNYNTDQAYKTVCSKKKALECKATFQSKVERFKQETVQKEVKKQSFNDVYFLLNKDKEKASGKLYGIMRDRKSLAQTIPSIPNYEQSFGYRIDPTTNQLVLNENPFVLLAKRQFTIQDRKSKDQGKNGPGTYFVKAQKNEKALKWPKQEEEKIANLVTPDFMKYTPVLKWNEKGNVLNGKCERFYENVGEKRDQLLIKMMNKQFNSYIEGDLKKIIADGNQNMKKQQLKAIIQKSKQIQCFLSKEERIVKFKPTKKVKQPKPQSSMPKLVNKDDKQNKKQSSKPFWKGQQRFKENNLGDVGPGSYSKDVTEYTYSKNKNICLGLTEERFSKDEFSKEPGPGSYILQEKKASISHGKRVNKLAESLVKFANNQQTNQKPTLCLKNNKNRHEGNENMVIGRIGKQKIGEKVKEKKGGNVEEKQVVQKIKELFKNEKIRKKDEAMIQRKNQIKLKKTNIPLNFQMERSQTPGPGTFSVSTSLLKKTFNVTYT